MTPLKIYIADLTHDTVGLATDVFPLNIGYIAVYASDRFGDKIDIKLFKYIANLEAAIEESQPDVLALSNYPWCYNIGKEMFRRLKELKPQALRFLGGPNFPNDPAGQLAFLNDRPDVDAHVVNDGEFGFANLIELVLHTGLKDARNILKKKPVGGCANINASGQLQYTDHERTPKKDLDEIPSPYLSGILDQFFDGRLIPMVQTNRGCPFSCTFCRDGHETSNFVRKFTIERVVAEIDYIATHTTKNMRSLLISDLNFGMYKRDVEICEEIANIREKRDYPHYIECTTGKNSKERVVNALEKLGSSLGITMAVQSLTPEVLKNIRRDNISIDEILGLKKTIKRAKLPATSEVILALPGETKESHFQSLQHLINAEMEYMTPYTLIMVNGSELAMPESRKRWGYDTKYRVIPRDFTQMRSGRKVIEVEEVVISTNTLPFEDYIECRQMAFLVPIFNTLGLRAMTRFLIQNNIQVMDVMKRVLDDLRNALPQGSVSVSVGLVEMFNTFTQDTRNELWHTEEELIEFFQDDVHFQGLIEGRYGANLIQTYSGRILANHMESFVNLAMRHVTQIATEHNISDDAIQLLEEIEMFCRGRTFNLMGEDRRETVYNGIFHNDIEAWASDPDSKPISEFKCNNPRDASFIITDEQYKIVEDVLNHFGHNDLGRGKAAFRMTLDRNILWRTLAYDA